MVENGWEILVFSESRQKAVMSKREAVKYNAQTGVPYNLNPKLGDKDPELPGDQGVTEPDADSDLPSGPAVLSESFSHTEEFDFEVPPKPSDEEAFIKK